MNTQERTPSVEELWMLVREQQAEIAHLRVRRRGLRSLLPGKKMMLGLSLLAALAVNGNAFAAIPDAAGLITGCYAVPSGKIRIIDTATTTCLASERQVTWYSSGAPIAASAITGVLPISHGGTGSATQNFVDLSSDQSIAGTKTFTGSINGNLNGSVTGNVTGNLTGDVTGNVSGNAGSVTNGLYSIDRYEDPAWLTSLSGSKIGGDIPGNARGFNGQLAGDVTGGQDSTRVSGINGTPVSGTPSAGQVLGYNGADGKWEPQSIPASYTPDVQVRWQEGSAQAGGYATTTAGCPSGYAAISGGFEGSAPYTQVTASYPINSDNLSTYRDGFSNNAWYAVVNNTNTDSADNFEVYVVCLRAP